MNDTAVHAVTRDARPAAGQRLLHLEGVTKVFLTDEVETHALSNVHMTVHQGEWVAIVGPSGSGKTTLLHILAGLLDPSAGSASVLGSDLAELGREERAALRRDPIAFIPQDPALTPFLSARENVELAEAIRGRVGEQAHEVLAAVGLSERAGQRVSRLSAGEQVRVAVARALAARPRLLLVDEPTARLDQANALTLAALLSTLARETGAAVVCATHDPVVIEQADVELALAASERVVAAPA